jgi:hypothetical protein
VPLVNHRPFRPDDLPGLTHWWDASDTETITMAGDVVSSWRSKAGARVVASQSVANNRPRITNAAGRTAILFDGQNDGLDFATITASDETWLIAAQQFAGQSGGTGGLITDANAGYGITVFVTSGRFVQHNYGGFTEGATRLTLTYSNDPAVLFGPAVIGVIRSAATGGLCVIDGTQRFSGVNGSFSSLSSSLSSPIKTIGYYSSSTWPFSGWIGEILRYDRALADAEWRLASRYLGDRWGVRFRRTPSSVTDV